MEYTGFGGVIVLALNIWAILSIFSSANSTGSKVLWILLVLVLPIVGFIIWLIAGPKGRTAAA